MKKLREILTEGFLGTNISPMRHIGISTNKAIGLTGLKKSVFKRLRAGLPRKYYNLGAMKQSVYQKIGLYNNPKMTMLRQSMKGNIPVQTPLGVFKTGGGGQANYNRKPGNYVPRLRKTSSIARDIISHHKQQGGLASFKARGGRMKVQQKSWNRKPGL